MPQQQSASWSELLSGRNGLRSLALAGGVALHAVNVYIVATILPSVVKDIGGLEYYAWNMTLFVVASILGSAVSPKAVDAFGLRRAFFVAIAIFAAGTALCAAAPTMGWMLVGRTVQGLGGGLLLGLCYSASRVVFEERLWSRAMALISSMWGVATLAGPAIGGIFAQVGLWRWAFWTILPVAAGLAWLVRTQVPLAKPAEGRTPVGIPFTQIALMIIAVLVVSVASLSLNITWNTLGIAVALAVSVGIGVFDQHASVRLLPTGGYTLRGGLGGIYACVGLISAGITVEFFVPYFLQVIHDYSPLSAGYMCALMSAGWTVGSVSTSSRPPHIIRKAMRAGPIVSAVSLASLGVLIPLTLFDNALITLLLIALPLFGVGVGIGMCWPHLLTQVFRTAPAGQENMASSAIITVQLYATAFGAAVGGMVANAAGLVDPGGIIGTQQASMVLLSGLALSPALAAFIMVGVVRDRPAGT